MERDNKWVKPIIEAERIIKGDMPGDKIQIGESHILRADTIYPFISAFLNNRGRKKTVISVFGGSGVGKSEIGSLLASYCREASYPAYVLSGDNYPYRIPSQNDAERLNVYRSAALTAMSRDNDFCNNWDRQIHKKWYSCEDADPDFQTEPGMKNYQKAGRDALSSYLGSDREIDFNLLNSIIEDFKNRKDTIALKRMGRIPEDIHFEAVDFRSVEVLIIEWTHGNNPVLKGVDFPVFLYSTPEETLAHRLSRGRDKGVDNPFTKLVLHLEQERLNKYAQSAQLIVTKTGEIISPGDIDKGE